jgi:WD40 repeat protein
MSHESTSFRTKEGTYKKGSFQYCRETRKAHSGKELSPVTVSFVSCKDKEGTKEWITFNSAKEFYFYPFHGMRKFPDLTKPADKRTYRAPTVPVCHDFNLMTRSTERLDLIIGFSTGPLQHVNPITRRSLCAFNDDCSIDKTRVTCVKWVPGSETLFVSSHRSGNLYVWSTVFAGKSTTGPVQFLPHAELQDATISTVKTRHKSSLHYRWSIGHGAINRFAFSPDLDHIAVASQDGFMRIYHFQRQEFHSRMRSYFGGITCVCWSPDSCYVVTGGEDDLITVWSFHHRRVVARGMGHQSYISAVAFDPYTTVLPDAISNQAMSLGGDSEGTGVSQPPSIRGSFRLSGAIDTSSIASSPFLGRLASEAGRGKEVLAYRLGSVGQDSHLCLWDLSEDALKIRRPFARSRSRMSKMMSSQQQQLHSAESLSFKQRESGQDTSTSYDEENISRPRSNALVQDTAQKTPTDSLPQEGVSTDQPSTDHTQATTEEPSQKNAPTATMQSEQPQTSGSENEQKRKSSSQGRESEEKDTGSPAGSGTSDQDTSTDDKTRQSNSKSGKKNKTKGGKEGKKVHIRGQQKSLRDPMKRVMKFVGIGGQSHHNGRREVSAFETCNSDDIAPKMEEVNVIEPLVAERVDRERLSDLVFRDDCIVVASYDGYVSLWVRPGVEAEEGEGEGGGGKGGEAAVPSQQPPDSLSSTDQPTETHPGLNSPRPGGGPNSPLKQTTV